MNKKCEYNAVGLVLRSILFKTNIALFGMVVMCYIGDAVSDAVLFVLFF